MPRSSAAMKACTGASSPSVLRRCTSPRRNATSRSQAASIACSTR
jgi:hypothetical protein